MYLISHIKALKNIFHRLQLEDWVYAKSVHAFMRLHIPHADPDSKKQK